MLPVPKGPSDHLCLNLGGSRYFVWCQVTMVAPSGAGSSLCSAPSSTSAPRNNSESPGRDVEPVQPSMSQMTFLCLSFPKAESEEENDKVVNVRKVFRGAWKKQAQGMPRTATVTAAWIRITRGTGLGNSFSANTLQVLNTSGAQQQHRAGSSHAPGGLQGRLRLLSLPLAPVSEGNKPGGEKRILKS